MGAENTQGAEPVPDASVQEGKESGSKEARAVGSPLLQPENEQGSLKSTPLNGIVPVDEVKR